VVPGVRRVMEMAKVDWVGREELGASFAAGTGMYEVMRWSLDCL